MKRSGKISNVIIAIILAFAWIYFLVRFFDVGVFARILALIVLLPFTIKVVYSFLLERSQNKNSAQNDALAENFKPFSGTDTSPVSSNSGKSCYCTECGAENEQGASFCVNCGKPLM